MNHVTIRKAAKIYKALLYNNERTLRTPSMRIPREWLLAWLKTP